MIPEAVSNFFGLGSEPADSKKAGNGGAIAFLAALVFTGTTIYYRNQSQENQRQAELAEKQKEILIKALVNLEKAQIHHIANSEQKLQKFQTKLCEQEQGIKTKYKKVYY